tara:strand:+ start:1905 stop:3329 length:1425 start_codon:yes stop_codon:yes gene_type:complete
MSDKLEISNTFINGSFVEQGDELFQLINPANESIIGNLKCSSDKQIDEAICLTHEAVGCMRSLSKDSRIDILQSIYNQVSEKRDEFGNLISLEMGAPIELAKNAHINMGLDHLTNTINVLKNYKFRVKNEGYDICKISIGAVGLITPWNWPLNQLFTKVASAIAAGCSILVKPSEYSPLSARLVAEIISKSDLPKGSFNMINGIGKNMGHLITSDPRLSMISFTGSTRAGIEIQKSAANTIKKVSLELGGKSAHIIFDDVEYSNAIPVALDQCFLNSGQSCSSPTRLLVPEKDIGIIEEIALNHAKTIKCINPSDTKKGIGPLVNINQFNQVKRFIQTAIEDGHELLHGDIQLPDNQTNGYYIKPTIFTRVENSSDIAQNEIFGPVLCIITYKNLDEALKIVNESKYGLSSYITCSNYEDGFKFAKNIEAGQTIINKPSRGSFPAPFGGFKMSGNGREHGIYGLEEYLETKAII